MTTFADGESGLSVRTKINDVLQHMDGTAGTLVVNEAGADVDFRVESDTNANAIYMDGATGNVGLGNIPSTGGYGLSLEMNLSNYGGALHFAAISADNYPMNLTANAVTSGVATWKYLNTASATRYEQVAGNHRWFNAPSGTAGGTVTFTQAMTLNSSGNLGIGTTSPSESLSISGSNATGNKVFVQNTRSGADTRAIISAFGSDSNGNRVSFGNNAFPSDPYSYAMTRSNTNYSAWAWSSYALNTTYDVQSAMTLQYISATGTQTTRLLVDYLGNLGLGTGIAVPSARLHVAVPDAGSSSAVAGIVISRDGGSSGFKSGALQFVVGGGGGTAQIYSERLGGLGANLIFAPSDTGGTLTERMRISAAGNVLIGSTYAIARLVTVGDMGLIPTAVNTLGSNVEIRSAMGSSSSETMIANELVGFNNAGNYSTSLKFFTRSEITTAERMRINSLGNVGINTTIPTSRLDIFDGNLNLRAPNYATTTRIGFGNPARSDDAAFIQYVGNGNFTGYISFGTNAVSANVAATEKMRIDPDGNLGIGTTSPNAASIIDAQSTTKGVRFPNMTTTQKNLIANVAGNVIFDTTLGKLCVNTGSGWQTITSA